MKRIKQALYVAIFSFLSTTASAQEWVKIESLPSSEFSAMEVIGGKIYTITGKKLFTSTDGGQTWNQSVFTNQNNVSVNCLKEFNGKIYAGTSKGIFSAPINAAGGTWNQDINSFEVNSFAEKNGTLYASMEVNGVIKLDGTTWTAFSNGIPSYSKSVTEVLDTPAGLLAISGANGTFYRYDFAKKTWIEDYYIKNTINAGLSFDDIIVAGNSLYVSQYRRIMRSDDLGESWTDDKQGLIKGINRFMLTTEDKLYSISSTLTNGTRINSRGLYETGTNWAEGEQVLPFYTYAIRKVGDYMFIAANNGVYTTMGTLGTQPPAEISNAKIYPNPSAGEFTIESKIPVNAVEVYDMTGRMILSMQDNNGINSFSVDTEGVYIARIIADGTSKTQKVIVKK